MTDRTAAPGRATAPRPAGRTRPPTAHGAGWPAIPV